MTLLTPYAIDGAMHPASLLRRQLQYALGDGSGIARPGDFKVLPLNQPGRGVRIASGGVVIQSRESETASRGSYGVENVGEIEFFGGDGAEGIPGTGSGETRRDMIVVEILDPEMAGVPDPADPDTAEYSRISIIPGVPASARRVEDLTNPAYANMTAYCIAIIVWPASTTTITAGMIVDTRQVQSPRRELHTRLYELPGDAVEEPIVNTNTYPTGQVWPLRVETAWAEVPVPTWATRARIVMTWNGVKINGTAAGWLWAQLGMSVNPDRQITQARRWRNDREGWRVAGDVAIPASMRGTLQRVYPRANRSAGSQSTSPSLDSASGLDLTVEFFETAV